MLAVLYDIHGNLVALGEVLRDAEAAGADSYLLGGDFASWSPWPRETIERLRELSNATWVRGNGERWLREPPVDRPEVMEALSERDSGLGTDEGWLYSLQSQFEQDAKDGFTQPAIASIFAGASPKIATLDTVSKVDGNVVTNESSGVVYSGVYSLLQNDARLAGSAGKLAVSLLSVSGPKGAVSGVALVQLEAGRCDRKAEELGCRLPFRTRNLGQQGVSVFKLALIVGLNPPTEPGSFQAVGS